MSKSLRVKLVFIMMLLILLLMTVVGVFLVQGVQSFYTNEFYRQMQSVFAGEDISVSLTGASGSANALGAMRDILDAYSGQLGIDGSTRNYYILSGDTGRVLATSSRDDDTALNITPNIVSALSGQAGYSSSLSGDYMDVAVPVQGGQTAYIVYIIDNKQTVQDLNRELFSIIIESIVIGLVVAGGVSLVLSHAMLRPIQNMTKAAEEMADGDFSRKIEVQSGDEIGILADTFNNMASQLESTLETIRQSEQVRREFVANVSHELRTPITSIRSYAETLMDTEGMPDDMRQEFLGVILNESDRMTKIVGDLLELSRFDSGNSQFKFEEFSVERSVRDIYAAIALEAKKHQHVMNLELEWKLPKILGDKARIEQVLINIMSNAVKYTPDGGTIDIYSGCSGDYVWIKVQDTGIGIPNEDMPKIFDRFYRVDKARSRASGGTGLGLSIAREIIVRHGGDIFLESVPGEGTTVTVKLPIEGPKDV